MSIFADIYILSAPFQIQTYTSKNSASKPGKSGFMCEFASGEKASGVPQAQLPFTDTKFRTGTYLHPDHSHAVVSSI